MKYQLGLPLISALTFLLSAGQGFSQGKNDPVPKKGCACSALDDNPSLDLLKAAKIQLESEAARMQIQGRALSPAELARVKALKEASTKLAAIIASLI